MANLTCTESKAFAASDIVERFILTGSVVYRGLASTVFLGIEKATRIQVAIKVLLKVNMSQDELRNARAEAEIHAGLPPHRDVLCLLAAEETDSAILFVMPYTSHGDLWSITKYSQTYCERQVRNVAAQMLASLRHIHAAGIAHCDVKPQNFLLRQFDNKYCVQLCDFGLAAKVEKGSTLPHQGLRGSSGWLSPEMHGRRSYGQEVDLFSAGLILFRMLGGYEPFYPPTKFSQMVEFDETCWCHITASCKDLLVRLLCVDPAKRITAADACDHPWISGSPPSEPTEEQLRSLSEYGALPRTDVVFLPASELSTDEKCSFSGKQKALPSLAGA